MTREEFESLVLKLEEERQRNPQRYKLKVILLAIAANSYLGIVLFILVLLFSLALLSVVVLKAIGLKIALVIGFFLWMVVKALWVKDAAPDGFKLTSKDVPELFTIINSLRQDLRSPKFHEVLLTDDFNASVVQIPRLGLFGWDRNFLLIGLPLMKSLTVEQFRAVLAHEFGHLAKAHGRFSNWVYRQRLRWQRLVQILEATESHGGFLFKPFLNRFVPYFSAYSFPLARANEYEADATSAQLTNPNTVAEALTSVHVIGSYLHEKYWPGIYKQANNSQLPNFAPFSSMGSNILQEIDLESSKAWLYKAMASKTDLVDTHPSLSDRLSAIGSLPNIRFPEISESADLLLGNFRVEFTKKLDEQWIQAVTPSWSHRYSEVKQGRSRLSELNEKFSNQLKLEIDEEIERARLTETIAEDPENAFLQFKDLYGRASNDSIVCYSYGHRLLERDDPVGAVIVERSIWLNSNLTIPASQLLYAFFTKIGDKAAADKWETIMINRMAIEDAAARERERIDSKSKFLPHELTPEQIQSLYIQLKVVTGLKKAWIVRKQLNNFPESPLYVLGFSFTPWYSLHSDKKREKVQNALTQLSYPGEALIISVESANSSIGRSIKKVKNSHIL